MESSEKGFADYIAILVKRKWHFLVPLGVVVSISCVFTLMLPKIYVSSATILVQERGVNPVKDILNQGQPFNQGRLDAVRSVITSQSRIEEIIKRLGLDKRVKLANEYEKLVSKIRDGLRVRLVSLNSFEVSWWGADPLLSMQIVNVVCGFFVEEQTDTLYAQDDKSFAVLTELIDHYERKVNNAVGVLTKFEIENKGQMPGSLNSNFKALEKSQLDLANIELQIKETQFKVSKLQKQLTSESSTLEGAISQDENLTPLERELKVKNSKLESLLVIYTEKHPEIIKIRSEIDQLKRRLANSYRLSDTGQDMEEAANAQQFPPNPAYLKLLSQIDKAEGEIAKLQEKSQNIQKDIEMYQERLKNVPQNEQEYAMLQRDHNINKNILRTLLNRLEQVRIDREFRQMEKGTKFETISKAQLPIDPVSPKMSKNIIVGSILGIIFGVCVAFWAEYTDHSLRDLDEIQKIIKVPVLATVPTVPTEMEIIHKRRVNMLMFVAGSFYVVFIVILIIRELVLAYIPQLMYLQTYKNLIYQLMNLVNIYP